MIESVVIRCIKQLNPSITHIVGGQNGYHPKTVFIIAEEVDSYLVGTASRPITTKTGKWVKQQTKKYIVRVGVQGKVAGAGKPSDDPSEIAEMLQLMMDTPMIRQNFQDEGYTLNIDRQILPLSMNLDSDQYKRYSITLNLTTSISFEYELSTMLGVEAKGIYKEDNGTVIEEIEDVIHVDD